MELTRNFVGWNEPFLKAVARLLLEEWGGGSTADMRDVYVVLPGRRAARRLEELLAQESDSTNLALFPPSFITPGVLPELLYVCEREIATPVQEILAWQISIGRLDAGELRKLVKLPADSRLDWKSSLELAECLASLWRELSASCLSFDDLRQVCRQQAGEGEFARWTVLSRLFEDYQATLEERSLADTGSERNNSAKDGGKFESTIVLAGVVDLPQIHRNLLAANAGRVQSYVFAPESEANRFDDFGCLLVDEWAGAPIDSTQVSLRTVDTTSQLGGAVRASIIDAGRPLARSEITVGVADEEMLPFLQAQLSAAGVDAHAGAGNPLSTSELGKMLRAVAAYVSHDSFANLAALVRVPAVEQCLRTAEGIPSACAVLDSYYRSALPSGVDQRMRKSSKTQPVVAAVDALFASFYASEAEPIDYWSTELRALLYRLYSSSSEEELNSSSIDALSALVTLIAEIEDAAFESLKLTAAQFLNLLLLRSKSVILPEPQQSDAVELLSWLELALDDAPIVVVAGLNEPALPRASVADPFLPDSFRQSLGLVCFRSRWARDAYLFQTMLFSKEHLGAIALRRSADEESLALSRLLVSMDGPAQAQRISSFYQQGTAAGDRRLFFDSESSVAAYQAPELKPAVGKRLVMSVTSFRDYIECPYRFYLKHFYKLAVRDDRALELDAANFGTLIHAVLEQFGRSEAVDFTDVAKIGGQLESLLDAEMLRRFGRKPQPAVLVQGRQARSRLWDFAGWQAQRRQSGWRIKETEVSVTESDNVQLALSGGGLLVLTGKIDRVEVHERTGSTALLDYKTFAKPKTPQQAHQDYDGSWIDLQLPLYVELMQHRDVSWPEELGYVCLPAARLPLEKTLSLAEWSQDDIADAKHRACLIAEEILEGQVPEPVLLSSRFDDFAAICGEGMLHDLTVQLEEVE
ncbi:MAG: PD-(D/E)XK nuclease family protein [Bdellovibrionales bacterium]|nr:PD-(D/E)XK nuclease family protein [Bdellovibrionales bacterium]